MLAEKYRPQTFEQVIGQPKTIQAIRYYLRQDTPAGKSFLLTGPSGSGKTTLAYCAARHWGVSDFSIIKIESAQCDVDRLRQLASDSYIMGAGLHGRKAYVIDEIHTVTGRAQDRLLSLLEELPAHVVLFGTTTEADWSGVTLYSRFARLTLQKPSASEVAAHLESIAQREGLPIPADGAWAQKMVKYHGLNLRDLLNQLPARLLTDESAVVAA